MRLKALRTKSDSNRQKRNHRACNRVAPVYIYNFSHQPVIPSQLHPSRQRQQHSSLKPLERTRREHSVDVCTRVSKENSIPKSDTRTGLTLPAGYPKLQKGDFTQIHGHLHKIEAQYVRAMALALSRIANEAPQLRSECEVGWD